MLDCTQWQCRPVQLEDRSAVEAIRARAGHQISAHAFTSLFLWQKVMGLSICLREDAFFVRFEQRGENAWFYPCGSEEEQVRFLRWGLKTPDFSLHYIRQEDVEFVQEHFPGKFRFEEARGDSEYICDRQAQVEMPGKTFRNLRAKVRKSQKKADWFIKPITENNKEIAVQIVQNWENLRADLGDGGVAISGLQYFDELGFQGILLYDAEGAEALAYGAMIADGVFDLHVTKTLLPNIDSYLKWELYRRLDENVRWINQEEDLNLFGLRTNKMESIPDHMIPLWKGELV